MIFDTVVAGAGAFGAWIAYKLRRSGRTVALVDAYGPANPRSSSTGESRIIRASYGPDELYAKWAVRSLRVWKQLLADTGQRDLFKTTGVLWTTPEGDPRSAVNRQTLTRCGVRFESLSYKEVTGRFPQIRFPNPVSGTLEPEGGVLLAKRAVEAVVREAVRLGTDYRTAAVAAPPGKGRLKSIQTGPGESLGANHFVYACGPWLPKVFPALLADRIHVTRQEVFYFGTAPNERRFSPPAMPVWLDYTDPRGGYAIPAVDSSGCKIGFDAHGPDFDPDREERMVSESSIEAAREFVRERFPDLAQAPVTGTRVCQYENTGNGDFLIDRHPDFYNVWIAGGGSGHGFKHGPAVGDYVESLISGRSDGEPRFGLAGKTSTRARSVY